MGEHSTGSSTCSGQKHDSLDEVVESFLYLSSLDGAKDLGLLHEKQITHVLTVGGGMEAPFPMEFSYQLISNIVDVPEALIYLEFQDCFSFIEHAKSQSGRVLVHCEGGVSRSATVCAAYLMLTEKLTAKEAVAKLQKVRPVVFPNNGFKKQLEVFELHHHDTGLSREEVLSALAEVTDEFENIPEAKHHGHSVSILSQDIFETPPENYNYELETSSKASLFIPTILEEQNTMQRMKRLAHTISDDGALQMISEQFHPSSSRVSPQRPSYHNNMSSNHDREMVSNGLAELSKELDHQSAGVDVEVGFGDDNNDDDNDESDHGCDISDAGSFIDYEEHNNEDDHQDELGDGNDDDEDEELAKGESYPMIARLPLITSQCRSSTPPVYRSTSPASSVKSGDDGENSVAPPTKRIDMSSRSGTLKRFRTSSTSVYSGGADTESIVSGGADEEGGGSVAPGSPIAEGDEAHDSDEVEKDDTEKTATKNVVGKVLLGYQMTPSDKQVVMHWLAQKPKELKSGLAFKGLRQALKMMRRFVCLPGIGGEEDQNAKGIEGLRHSLMHVSKMLEKFTGFPLHSPEFMRMLQSEEGLDMIMIRLESEFKNALDDVRSTFASDDGKSQQQATAAAAAPPPPPLFNVVVDPSDIPPKVGLSVVAPPPLMLAAEPKTPTNIPTTDQVMLTSSSSGKRTFRKKSGDGFIHRRRRSATIDLLLLLAKLGLRREQTGISHDAYRQFSQLLEGGAREKAALEALDQSSAVELLGYLESFPENIKNDERIKRLGSVCTARLVLMVAYDTAAEICDQLLAQPRLTGYVREVATYALHFSGAAIGSQMDIIRKAKADIASTKLTAAYRGFLDRKALAERREAAKRIQIWTRHLREKEDILRTCKHDDLETDEDEYDDHDAEGDVVRGGYDDDDDDEDNALEEAEKDDILKSPRQGAYLTTENISRKPKLAHSRSGNLRSWQSFEVGGKSSAESPVKHEDVREQYRGMRQERMVSKIKSTLDYASKSLGPTIQEAIDKARDSRLRNTHDFLMSQEEPATNTNTKVFEVMYPTMERSQSSEGPLLIPAGFRRHSGATRPPSMVLVKEEDQKHEQQGSHQRAQTTQRNTAVMFPDPLHVQTFPAGPIRQSTTPAPLVRDETGSRRSFPDSASATSSTSFGNSFFLHGVETSPRNGERTVNPIHALQGLLRHLCTVVVSEARRDLNQAFQMQQKLKQLQQYAKNLKSVHPVICVADKESREALKWLPKANSELSKWLKEHPKGYGRNQTPYVYDFELRVLAFFPPCEFDTALQPPNDTSAAFRKILATVFELMPCDEESLNDLTETTILSQHASAGYAITTTLHYLDKMTNATSYMQNHHLGDEREGVSGTVAAGYVRYDADNHRYVFTEESGHYGQRWMLPGTRQSLGQFMEESELKEHYHLKPFFRHEPSTATTPASIQSLFQNSGSTSTLPVLTPPATPNNINEDGNGSDWSFSDGEDDD